MRTRACLLVPGGVDASGTERVIPCILDLIEQLSAAVDLQVLALRQEERARTYQLRGTTVHCLPRRQRSAALRWLTAEHRRRPFQVLHALWMHPQGTAAALAGRLLGIPVLLHVNGGDLARIPDIGFGGRASLPGRVRLRLALAGATRVTVPSDAMVAAASSLAIRAERLTLGVSLDRWPVLPPRPRPGGTRLRLLSVGSINQVKDHRTLLHAIALLQRRGVAVELECVGEDTLGGSVQRLAGQLGLDRVVRFCGFLPQFLLRWHYEQAHALVVSSRHEADPIAALEAALAGLAVVGTRVGHLAEWALADTGALTCEPGDPAGLADVIEQLAADDALRQQLARTVQAHASHHDAKRAAGRVRELYEELSNERG